MRIPALQVRQPSGRCVYTFGVIAQDLLALVQVSRVRRDGGETLFGYQRPEASAHISEIRRYLESDDAVLPNAIVIAFDDRVVFEAEGDGAGAVTRGVLVVPDVDDADPCGFVIDGQQRLAAVTTANVKDFPIVATALIEPSVAEQRKQFVLVNRTKPLPQGLVYELLPELTGCLPQVLTRQQLASSLCQLLNFDPNSSLFQMIRTPTCPYGLIKDNSMRRALAHSLTDGALARLSAAGKDLEVHVADLADVVSTFWEAVKNVFPEAMSLPPNKSRLTHGVGVVSCGFLMDQFYATKGSVPWTVDAVSTKLAPLAEHCAWTGGHWEFGPDFVKPWNDLQNTDRDIRVLVNFFKRMLLVRHQPPLSVAAD